MSKPADWTPSDEQNYQQALRNLKARIDSAGPNDDTGMVYVVYEALADLDTGREYFLKAQASELL